jgi:hypothetical protein
MIKRFEKKESIIHQIIDAYGEKSKSNSTLVKSFKVSEVSNIMDSILFHMDQ